MTDANGDIYAEFYSADGSVATGNFTQEDWFTYATFRWAAKPSRTPVPMAVIHSIAEKVMLGFQVPYEWQIVSVDASFGRLPTSPTFVVGVVPALSGIPWGTTKVSVLEFDAYGRLILFDRLKTLSTSEFEAQPVRYTVDDALAAASNECIQRGWSDGEPLKVVRARLCLEEPGVYLSTFPHSDKRGSVLNITDKERRINDQRKAQICLFILLQNAEGTPLYFHYDPADLRLIAATPFMGGFGDRPKKEPFAWDLGRGPLVIHVGKSHGKVSGDVLATTPPKRAHSIPIVLQRAKLLIPANYDRTSGKLECRGKWGLPSPSVAQAIRKAIEINLLRVPLE